MKREIETKFNIGDKVFFIPTLKDFNEYELTSLTTSPNYTQYIRSGVITEIQITIKEEHSIIVYKIKDNSDKITSQCEDDVYADKLPLINELFNIKELYWKNKIKDINECLLKIEKEKKVYNN